MAPDSPAAEGGDEEHGVESSTAVEQSRAHLPSIDEARKRLPRGKERRSLSDGARFDVVDLAQVARAGNQVAVTTTPQFHEYFGAPASHA